MYHYTQFKSADSCNTSFATIAAHTQQSRALVFSKVVTSRGKQTYNTCCNTHNKHTGILICSILIATVKGQYSSFNHTHTNTEGGAFHFSANTFTSQSDWNCTFTKQTNAGGRANIKTLTLRHTQFCLPLQMILHRVSQEPQNTARRKRNVPSTALFNSF